MDENDELEHRLDTLAQMWLDNAEVEAQSTELGTHFTVSFDYLPGVMNTARLGYPDTEPVDLSTVEVQIQSHLPYKMWEALEEDEEESTHRRDVVGRAVRALIERGVFDSGE